MRKSAVAVAMLAAFGLVACAQRSGLPEKNVLFLRTSKGVALVTALPQPTAVTLAGAVPSTDWSAVVGADRRGGDTRLVALDSFSGNELWSRSLDEPLEVKVASPYGRWVALGPPGPSGYGYGRSTTPLVVVSEDGSTPQTIRLKGNFEPEAFSTDGRSLFVIEYLPPRNPDSYRVRRLDLSSEKVVGVYTPDAELQRAMGGSARIQAASPDGRRLYTLYSLENGDGSMSSFIHVLSLDRLWAHCIDLPRSFGAVSEDEVAMAVSPDGGRLYVADAGTGAVAEVDTRALTVTRSADVDFDTGGVPIHAVRAANGKLYLASGSSLLAVDAATLAPGRSWVLEERIRGLQASRDGRRLFVGLKDRILVLATGTGKRVGVLQPDAIGRIDQLGQSTRSLEEPRTEFTCAC